MSLLAELAPLTLAFVLAGNVWASAPDGGLPRSHAETITTREHEYTIAMGGTMDGPSLRDPIGYGHWTQVWEPMRSVRLENVGDTIVVNPWIFTNDRGHWRTARELVDHVTAPYSDDLERAIALWWAETRHRYHTYTGDNENNDPIKVWNIYGHTLCGNDAYVLADLWRTAGLRVYLPRLQGHVISEVFVRDRRHLMDGDENIIVLLRDNQTIATEAEIRRDHDLIKRTHCYGILARDSRQIDEFSASLYAHDQQPPLTQQSPSNIGHEMKFTLRPGEALEWQWENRRKYHGGDPTVGEGKKPLANGIWEFRPRLTAEGLARDAESVEGLTPAEDGMRGPGAVVYRVRAPYVLVGGAIQASGTGLSLALSWDGQQWTALNLAEAGSAVVADLDDQFPPAGPARYEYLLRASVQDGGRLSDLLIRNDLQMAPLCMPYLELGENRIRYVDETAGPRTVRLTHTWLERSDHNPPSAPERPLFPMPGASVDRTQFQFRWQPAIDPDGDEIVDYQFQLSRYPDMRWPLSPNFFKLISRTADKGTASYTIPYVGLLNPDTEYFWQVRARDARGLWGPWSEVWTFRPGGPGVPRHLALRFDRHARTVTISWRDAPHGTRPVAWKVYGSDEQGFTVSDVPYQVWMGNQQDRAHDWQPFLPNLMTTTSRRSIQVVGPGLDLPNANRAFYRVVAVDANGVESGPSDYIAMPRPLIYTEPPTQGRVGQPLRAVVRSIASMGDLRCRTLEDPQKSYNAAFWDIEHPVYSLEGAPEWLSLDAQTGEISGTPPTAGQFTMTVRARIDGVGEDAVQFTLHVVP